MVLVITEIRKYTQVVDSETTVITTALSVYFEKVNDRLVKMDEKIMQNFQKNDSLATGMVNLAKSQQHLLADQLKDIQAKNKKYELEIQKYKQIKHRIVE